MMNLLIAVISDSFERVQEKKHAQFLLGRAQLIRDNNALFDWFKATCESWGQKGRFTESQCRWLHVIQPVEGGGDNTGGAALEWAGRVRALKKKMEVLQGETRQALADVRAEAAAARAYLRHSRGAYSRGAYLRGLP